MQDSGTREKSGIEYDYNAYRYTALLCFLVGIFAIVIVPIVNAMPTKVLVSGMEYYASIGICAGLGVIFLITGILVHKIYKQKIEQVAE